MQPQGLDAFLLRCTAAISLDTPLNLKQNYALFLKLVVEFFDFEPHMFADRVSPPAFHLTHILPLATLR